MGGQLQVQAPEGRFQTGHVLPFTLEELEGSIGDTEGLLEASWPWLDGQDASQQTLKGVEDSLVMLEHASHVVDRMFPHTLKRLLLGFSWPTLPSILKSTRTVHSLLSVRHSSLTLPPCNFLMTSG